VLPPEFRVRIAIHPSAKPKVLGGVEGAPDVLIVTKGFIALAEHVKLRQDEYEVLLAHEVGHMVLNHRFNTSGRELECQELAADSFVRRRFGTNSACQLAHALHRLAEPFGGWPPGSLEKKRELLNTELCVMMAEESRGGPHRTLREQ
jgi:peptidase M48-like protein